MKVKELRTKTERVDHCSGEGEQTQEVTKVPGRINNHS